MGAVGDFFVGVGKLIVRLIGYGVGYLIKKANEEDIREEYGRRLEDFNIQNTRVTAHYVRYNQYY